jgi:hypothetical protein
MDSSYLRAAGSATLQGLLTGAWVAAGGLPPAKRRLARAGAVATLSALALIGERDDNGERLTRAALSRWSETTPTPASASADDEGQGPPQPIPVRRLAVTAAGAGVSVGMIVGRRRLEKRWLAALTRDGHPHPHRALALRMGVLSFAGTLPGRLIRAYEARHRTDERF